MTLTIVLVIRASLVQSCQSNNGNESFLLRFGTGGAETACILVDAGDGVDLDSLLSPSDKLVAICLTHAHVDHYAELTAAHRGDVPIYTSPATATILDDVFDVATNKYDITASEAVTSAITPIDDWTDVVPRHRNPSSASRSCTGSSRVLVPSDR